jgi:hypothetical protein
MTIALGTSQNSRTNVCRACVLGDPFSIRRSASGLSPTRSVSSETRRPLQRPDPSDRRATQVTPLSTYLVQIYRGSSYLVRLTQRQGHTPTEGGHDLYTL